MADSTSSVLFAMLLLSGVSATAEDICKPIKQPAANDGYVQDQRIGEPGRYCVQEDLFVKGHRSWAEGGRVFNTSSIVLELAASDVIIDLGGRSIWSDGRLAAAIETPPSTARNAAYGTPVENPPKNLTIRNGTLRLDYSGNAIRFTGLGGLEYDTIPKIVLSDFGKPHYSETTTGETLARYVKNTYEVFEFALGKLMETLPAGPSAYPARGITIEKMKISTRPAAILIQGAGTVIRDSVIEVEAGTAIWIYGPGAVIENNTIIVHGRSFGPDPLPEADAPIRLIHGDGALIRNNRIVAADGAHHRAISLFYTGEITVEGNHFEGMTAEDEWAKAFTGTAKINAKDNSFKPPRKSLFGW